MARPLDPDTRRGEILDQAFVLFAEQGYHALSMRDLARELGATTGTLYHWFEGKPELFVAMLERQVDRHIRGALDAIRGGGDDAQRMTALGTYIAREARDLQRLVAVSIDFQRENPDRPGPVQAALDTYHKALAEGLGFPMAAAQIVVSVVIGELLQRILDPTRDLTMLGRLLPQIAHCAAEATSEA